MMDFDNILDIASQNQGLGSVQHKRYSLQAGPPKKDPKSRGVNPAAVQALLKKKVQDSMKKEIQFKKQKEDLMAKRVELKSDRKARAMASRTKDNFRGYNGVPVVEGPKKRRSKLEMQEEASLSAERFRNHSIDPEDDEDNYEYEQTDSEPEETPVPQRPSKSIGGGGSSGKPCAKKNTGPPKPAMNFADLLKLAEKKQFEPVELKAKPVKKEARLRTAEEIRELEMERKAKKQVRDRDSNTERERDAKPQSSSSSMRKGTGEREQKNCKPQKNHSERPGLSTGSEKKSHQTPASNRSHSSSKPTTGDRERERPKTSHSDRDRSRTGVSGSSGGVNSKAVGKATSLPSSSYKSTASDLSFKKEAGSLHPGRASGVPGTRPPGAAVQKPQHGGPLQTRPGQGSSSKQGPPDRGHKSGKVDPPRPGGNSALKSSGNSVNRTSSGGPPKAGGQPPVRPGVYAAERSSGNSVTRTSSGGPPKAGGRPQARPGDALKAKAGGVPQGRPAGRSLQGHPGGGGARPPGNRPGSGGLVPGPGSGPGRPKCTVVSETISSKNVGGPRMGMPPRTGVPPRPGMAPRPMMNRPPGTALPPITSAWKRKHEDEEEDYDSEMEDFIDDGGEEQDEISKHIKAIFGYDRTRYRDESDYALKFMESSWKDMQKEEARSLKLAVQEDLEEERREEEELQRSMKRRKKN